MLPVKKIVNTHTGCDTGRSSYIICMYIRLSSEDDDIKYNDNKNESNSITAQRRMLHEYINSKVEFRDCTVIERCDDGFSGTHFDNRPQFVDMIEMAKRGEIDCIIVKDFSRFGRDYIELGDCSGSRKGCGRKMNVCRGAILKCRINAAVTESKKCVETTISVKKAEQAILEDIKLKCRTFIEEHNQKKQALTEELEKLKIEKKKKESDTSSDMVEMLL